MKYYPIFLDLQDVPVLVAGAGKVALRKTRGLVEAGARVTVVAPRQEPGFAALPVHIVSRRFRLSDLRNARLVFAATDDRRTNRRIGIAARERAIFANIADSAGECGFLAPARWQKGNVQVAISTGGTNPRLAGALRRKLEDLVALSDLSGTSRRRNRL